MAPFPLELNSCERLTWYISPSRINSWISKTLSNMGRAPLRTIGKWGWVRKGLYKFGEIKHKFFQKLLPSMPLRLKPLSRVQLSLNQFLRCGSTVQSFLRQMVVADHNGAALPIGIWYFGGAVGKLPFLCRQRLPCPYPSHPKAMEEPSLGRLIEK